MIDEHPNDIGTFMVAVGAVVENPNTGKILVLHRSADNYKGNYWEVGYGRMDQGEDPQTALKREFFEETGIKDLEVVALLSAWHFYRGEELPENEVVGITYWAQTKTTKIKLSREHQDYKWVTPEEAMELIEVERIRQDVEDFLMAKSRRGEVTELAELAEARAKEQRMLADYQNLVRRTREEKAKISKYASQSLIEDLVQPLEHLRLAVLQLADPGLEMVKSQLWQALGEHGLTEIDPIGKKFDLDTMEAVEQKGDGDTVISVVRPGFKLNDKVIQHAKVVLGKPGHK